MAEKKERSIWESGNRTFDKLLQIYDAVTMFEKALQIFQDIVGSQESQVIIDSGKKLIEV